jgi:hypothetical protein
VKFGDVSHMLAVNVNNALDREYLRVGSSNATACAAKTA